MQRTVWRYGGFSVLIVAFYFVCTWLLFNSPNYTNQAILNWIGIVLSLVFVFVGIKDYRDGVNNGVLSFGEGMKVGILIIILPTLAFGLLDVLYVKYLDPAFFDKYYTWVVNRMQAKFPASEWAARLKKIQQRRSFFGNPTGQFVVMSLSVFVVGLIITAISTLLLKRKNPSIKKEKTKPTKPGKPAHPAW
jgi:hypothetical protein